MLQEQRDRIKQQMRAEYERTRKRKPAPVPAAHAIAVTQTPVLSDYERAMQIARSLTLEQVMELQQYAHEYATRGK